MTDRDAATGGTPIKVACTDLIEGLRAWRLWTKFAWHDMVAKYRRSWVGPFWVVLSAAIFIGALSFVYSALFRMSLGEYLPFVAVGVVTWAFISAIATESVTTFVESETYIRQVRVNLFVYVLRVIWRNMLVFAQQFVIVLFVLIFYGKLNVQMLPLATLGMFLFFLQAVWITPLLGLVGTRFRDLQPIITNLLQVLFFVTPIIWLPSLLGPRRWIADLNPLSSLIAIVREPLLGAVPSAENYAVVLLMTAAGLVLTMMAYGRFKTRIVYWL